VDATPFDHRLTLMHPGLASIVVALATWETWLWYGRRIAEAPEDVLALMMLVLALAVTPALRLNSTGMVKRLDGSMLAGLAILLVGYAASRGVLPPILRAAMALAGTIACTYVALYGRSPPVGVWGAAALALPVLPSLQFVLGYPMRIVSAALTVLVLQMQGLAVERQGTLLLWQGELIQFDAPCSGVRMLWAGVLLTLIGCVALGINGRRTLLAVGASLVVILAANVLRATSLFVIEARLVPQPPAWWHEGTGVVAFACAATVMLSLLLRLRAS
jgi:exosortase/archaeosortase family protein